MSLIRSLVPVAASTLALGLGFLFYQYKEARRNLREAEAMAAASPLPSPATSGAVGQTPTSPAPAASPSRRLPPAKSVPETTPAPPTEVVDEAVVARLEELKPLLANGRPIKGAVVMLVGDNVVPEPIEFVVGRETRLASEDGTFAITPSLRDDGTISYALAVTRQDPTTGQPQTENLPTVQQMPWGGFTLYAGRGRSLTFDNDDLGPKERADPTP